ncbi:MAG: hypothetical protein ABIS38_08785 [Sphingomicrobium sp.]
MLKLFALAAAAVSAAVPAAVLPTPALLSHAAWWETVTVTIAADGQANSCEYRTSLLAGTKSCDVVGPASTDVGKGTKDQYTRLTFERRFRPDRGAVGEDSLPSGDTLLGRQVLALAIDAKGLVAGCKIVAKAGEMTPDYGCEEAVAEKFETGFSGSTGNAREGYMSILVYGHEEHVV